MYSASTSAWDIPTQKRTAAYQQFFLNTSPALNEQCSKPILIILMISYRGYTNVILSKSIQYSGDYKQLKKKNDLSRTPSFALSHRSMASTKPMGPLLATRSAASNKARSHFTPSTCPCSVASPAKRHWDGQSARVSTGTRPLDASGISEKIKCGSAASPSLAC